MIKVAICDDDMAICELIEQTIERNNVSVEVFYKGEELIGNLISGKIYDIIFLDIELNSISGVDVGHKIRSDLNDTITQIIYISSKENYAMQLFKIRPADFLIKPFSNEEIEDTFNNISRLLTEENTIEFKNGYDMNAIKIKDIRYINSEARKLKVIAVNSEESFYGKIDDYIDQFEDIGFIRIHKSCVINSMHLSRYTYEFVMMNDGSELNISKPYRTKVRQQLMNIWRQKNDKFINGK